MGTRYTKKNLGDPNWSKPNNYKIKQNDAIYDVEIVPNKGVKGDVSAQPFNDKNAEDIENALVSLDDDLAFVEADYINNAEHALKQNITDNGLNTTNKTVVGAINEVKSEGEYHDLLQDDAIAIVNNKINALPMNGSLKNIRTSLVGIPTTFTNIDMFNTKQTVTNYQPLSLDYKGAAEPHIILMKTIGDYTFDFAIEATHTNGTDTTVILEAWVDGVLYDTATRTLVGGSNQINGVTGFFTYSKGDDTVPSEIYFRFRASQGNTSANKALINTNLLGNSAESSFTDTDHVTGTNLNEPTYNGTTTTFIINDIKEELSKTRTLINEKDIAYDDSVHGATPIQDVLLDIFNKSRANVGNDKNFITSFLVSDTAADLNNNLGTKLNSFLLSKIGVTIPPGTTYSFSMEAVTGKGITDNSYESANICRVSGGRFNFEFEFQYNEFANVRVINPNLKQEWSLDELGLDGSWHMTNVATNIKKAYDEVVSIIGNKTTFSITQGLFLETDGEHYGFASAIVNDIEARYGVDIAGTYAFEFSIKFGEYQGITSVNRNVTNFITIQSAGKRFYRHFHHDDWATSNWTDEVGAPHADMMVNVESYMTTSHGLSINAPYRNYISGITFWVADYDAAGSQFTTGDSTIRYVPRAKPKTNPTGSPSTDADTLFAANQSILNSKLSVVTPVTTVTEIGNMYLNVSYGEAGQQYPDGITLEGLMEDTDNDVILAMIVIHYGKINWDDSSNWLAYAPGVTYTPSLLNQPITTPEVGDNMEETRILKEVLDNA